MVDWVWQRVSWKSCSSWAPQRRCSFLTGSELQDKYISCQLVLIAFILFLLSLSLFCPDLRLCVVPLCEITCGLLPDTRGELLIQMCSLISTQILNHVLFSYLCRKSFKVSEVPTHQSLLHRVGSSYRLTYVNNFFKFFRFAYSPLDEDIAASDAYTLKSDSSSTWTSFPSRIPETVCTKNDATATYGVRLRRSLYGWKENFITFLTPPDSGP